MKSLTALLPCLILLLLSACGGTWIEMPYSAALDCSERSIEDMKLIQPYQFWQSSCESVKKRYAGEVRCKKDGKGLEVLCR